MKAKISLSILSILLGIVVFWQGLVIKNLKNLNIVGASTQYGMLGIYNNPAETLADITGSAIAIDSAGRVILSSTTVISSL